MVRFLIVLVIIFDITLLLKADEPTFGDRVDKCTVSYDELDELSGIVQSRQYPDVFWVHNDDGDIRTVYAINSKGEFLASVELEVNKSKDWEDISIAKSPVDGKYYLYIGDIGDNDAEYDNRKIYRILEPKVISGQKHEYIVVKDDDINIIEFEYDNGSRDAETMLVDPITNDIYVVSKREKNVSVYLLDYPQNYTKINTAEKLIQLSIGDKNSTTLDQIVGGDISPNGEEILLKSYLEVFYYKKQADESYREAFSKEVIKLPYLMEPQGEAICWSSNADGYYTISEMGPFKMVPHLYYYPRISSTVDEVYRKTLNLRIFTEKDSYFFEYTLPENSYISIIVIDLNGNIVKTLQEEFVFAGVYKRKIEPSDLPNGFYNLVIDSNLYQDTTKLIISK